MPINFKDFSASSEGVIICEISLPVRPSFKTKEVSRAVGDSKQYIAGLANYENGTQDLLTIWLPKKLGLGQQNVLFGTGLMRIESGGLPQLYGLVGEVHVGIIDGLEHISGKFDLQGVGFTVKGLFNINGLDPAF